jgi:chromosome segregation ATPase
MTGIDEINETECEVSPSRAVRMRILEQMAEALDDHVAGLYRRAAAFEEEEFLLNREVEDRQTEINRLLLKLESMRADRDRVFKKIESLSNEAGAIRDEIFRGEEAGALAAIERSAMETAPVLVVVDPLQDPMFFRRVTV